MSKGRRVPDPPPDAEPHPIAVRRWLDAHHNQLVEDARKAYRLLGRGAFAVPMQGTTGAEGEQVVAEYVPLAELRAAGAKMVARYDPSKAYVVIVTGWPGMPENDSERIIVRAMEAPHASTA